MEDWDNKYVIVEHALSVQDPASWVVSAVSDTLQASREILKVDAAPDRQPRTAYAGEPLGETLVLRRTPEGTHPSRAAIYHLRRLLEVCPDDQSPPAAAPPSDSSLHVQKLFERAMLAQAGVAVADQQAYTEANLYGFLGSQALAASDLDRAEEYLLKALDRALQIDHPPSIVKAYGSLGAVRSQQGNGPAAVKLLKEALTVARENKLAVEEGQTLANLAETYARIGDTHRALAFHEERLTLARRVGDRVGFAMSSGNLGISYFEARDLDKALKHLETAAREFTALGMVPELGRAYAYLGVAYQALGDAQRCYETYTKHVDLCHESGDYSTAGTSYVNLSEILYQNGHRKAAVALAREGYEQLGQIGAPEAALLQARLQAWS
jgi:tetratricopeptide (TPR) repeat protein